jgi:molybdopterin converting factor small subunit
MNRSVPVTSHISVKVFAGLGKYLPENAEHFPIEEPMTVLQVILRLGMAENEAELIFINHKKGELTTLLKDGDRLGLFPLIGGG